MFEMNGCGMFVPFINKYICKTLYNNNYVVLLAMTCNYYLENNPCHVNFTYNQLKILPNEKEVLSDAQF